MILTWHTYDTTLRYYYHNKYSLSHIYVIRMVNPNIFDSQSLQDISYLILLNKTVN